MERDALADALAAVRDLYTRNLEEHGLDSKAVGWRDVDDQLLRFDKLAYLAEVDRPGRAVTVNDWGCGYAAMFRYLDERADIDLGGYQGYDISETMLSAAREWCGSDPRVDLHAAAEVVTDADWSFVSGTFNVRMDATDDVWSRYVKDVLRMLASHSRRGFAFNLLTSYVDWRKDELFYADPAEFLTFCKSELSRYVTLLHDYPLYEWTIVVVQENPE